MEDNITYGAKCRWYKGAQNKYHGNHPRRGTQCLIEYPTNKNPAQSFQENAITVLGPRLYNSLPKYLKDIESVKSEKLKFELNKFLELILDGPKCTTMSPQQEATASSTSYLIGGLKESTTATVSDSAAEQA